MTQYKEIKRELMKEFKINSVSLDKTDVEIASKEANIQFMAASVITIPTTVVGRMYRIYLFSDEVGNAYYTAELEDESVSFHKNEIWKGVSYNIRRRPAAAQERKIYNIISGANHLGH